MKNLLFILLLSISGICAEYIGDQACAQCHKTKHKSWHGSDHDLAMQKATDRSVLGDFNHTSFTYNGIVTTFFKKGDNFMVRTDGPDGRAHDYEVTHTFGVHPLQQYMVPFPGGRLQVLDIAWDSRSACDGGQRWFHLHPSDNVTAGDVLHWSGPNLNWNYMCADCHSTHLKKGYDEKEKRYHTTYSAINVSCEACHGAGSEHVAWAKNPNAYKGTLTKGLAVNLSAFSKKRWEIDEKSGKPVRLAAIDRSEVLLCARCHSRRTQLDDDYEPGERFEEHYLPSILESNLYFDDGKIKDEVYVYGSFLQSRMYAEGVTCSDCHDPHTLKRKAEGDRVCNRCHRRVTYDTPKHHFHPKGRAGCIDCHMPPRTYMGVDVRNDHSFRIPRPDLSVDSDIPNACNRCHTDKNAQWAADVLKKQFGKIPKGKQRFAHALKALRTRSETAPQSLYDVLMNDAPDIAKATAATHLGDYPSQQTYMTIRQLLKRDDPMLRRSALQALESFPPQLRLNAALKMADDPVKSIRIEAARQLSGLPADALSSEQKQKRQNAIAEYEQTLRFSAERAESQTGLGTLYANLGKDDAAEAAFEKALRLQPMFIPGYVNYAHFLKTKGKEKRAFAVLEKGLKRLPDAAALHHALGLWYVRAKKPTKALASLEKAARLAPDDARYQYVYAVALAGTDTPAAIRVLETSLKHHSGDIDTLAALAYYHAQLGHTMQANLYRQRAERLQRFTPKLLR